MRWQNFIDFLKTIDKKKSKREFKKLVFHVILSQSAMRKPENIVKLIHRYTHRLHMFS